MALILVLFEKIISLAKNSIRFNKEDYCLHLIELNFTQKIKYFVKKKNISFRHEICSFRPNAVVVAYLHLSQGYLTFFVCSQYVT